MPPKGRVTGVFVSNRWKFNYAPTKPPAGRLPVGLVEDHVMKCPGCGEWVMSAQANCPACGLDLSILQAVDDLRSALRRTRGDSDRLAERVRELEQQVMSLEPLVVSKLVPPSVEPKADESTPARESPPSPPTATSDVEQLAEAPPPPNSVWSTPITPQAVTGWLSRESEVQLGQKWMLIVGIVTTVLAVGYFLKYSFDQNWVSPTGRVGLAYGAGFVALATGEVVRRRGFALFGLYLIGGGVAVLYFAGYAAFQFYDLVGQPIAFGSMVAVTLFAGVLSVFYDTKWLAVLGIVGGFLTPVVLGTELDNQVALMTYMAVLNAGILAIGSFKQWSLLNSLGMSATWMLFSAWYFRHYAEPKFWTTIVFLNLFFLTYACVPFAYYFLRKSKERMAGFSVTIPNAFIAFGYSYVMISNYSRLEMVGVVTVAYAAIFLAMAGYLYRRDRENLEAIILLLAKAMMFLIITVPILFSEHWITVFWAVQGVVLLWAALRLTDTRLTIGSAVLLLVSCAKLVFFDYPGVFHLRIADLTFRGGFGEMLVERWVTLATSAVALFVAGVMFGAAGYGRSSDRPNISATFFGVFGVLIFCLLNVEVAAYFNEAAPRARFASISVLWAIFASGLMMIGFARNVIALRRVAIALFAGTVLKVFVRDMANVETPYRILSFLVVGLLLVAMSFLYHRFAARLLPPIPKQDTA